MKIVWRLLDQYICSSLTESENIPSWKTTLGSETIALSAMSRFFGSLGTNSFFDYLCTQGSPSKIGKTYILQAWRWTGRPIRKSWPNQSTVRPCPVFSRISKLNFQFQFPLESPDQTKIMCIHVQCSALVLRTKYRLESWMLTSKEQQTSAFWRGMSKRSEHSKPIVSEW